MGKLNEDLIDLGLLKVVNLFSTRAWNDDDVVEDIKQMSEALHRDYKELRCAFNTQPRPCHAWVF